MSGRSAVLVRPSEHFHTSRGGDRSWRAGALGPPRPRGCGRIAHSFRIHVAIYVPVNLLFVAIWAAAGGGYFWPVWPALGWGFAVACHAAPILARLSSHPRGAAAPTHAVARPRHPGMPSADGVTRKIGEECQSMRSAAAPDGTVTILFSDIEASTTVNERVGDVRWLELLRVHHALVREQLDEHGGFEVKVQGDGFMVAFASARRAVLCARAIQHAIAARLGDHPDGPIRVRMGLHTGEAIREEADFYGKNVALAARIADHARGGEILASSVVKQLTESAGDVRFEDPREIALDGLAGTHSVHTVT